MPARTGFLPDLSRIQFHSIGCCDICCSGCFSTLSNSLLLWKSFFHCTLSRSTTCLRFYFSNSLLHLFLSILIYIFVPSFRYQISSFILVFSNFLRIFFFVCVFIYIMSFILPSFLPSFLFILPLYLSLHFGPGSSVGIATNYGLDGPGIESRWGEIFLPSRSPLRPSQPPVQWVPELSRV